MKNRSVNGTLTPSKKWKEKNTDANMDDLYLGYYLTIKYSTNIDKNVVHSENRVNIEGNGEFRFFIPENKFLYQPTDGPIITIVVHAADGTSLRTIFTSFGVLKASKKTKIKEDATDEFEIEINPKPKDSGESKSLNNLLKIQGKLIDSSAKTELNGLQIIAKGIVQGDDKNNKKIIFATNTNKDGYFFVSVEENNNIDYERVDAFIAGFDNDPIPIHLEDNKLPKQIVLVEDLSLLPDDLKRNNITNVLPDSHDLVNSSEYSQDIGGNCVNFTTPNRALEEFSFYHIVRTTEPEIKTYTISKNKTKKWKKNLEMKMKDAKSIFYNLSNSFNSFGLYKIEESENNNIQKTKKKDGEKKLQTKSIELSNMSFLWSIHLDYFPIYIENYGKKVKFEPKDPIEVQKMMLEYASQKTKLRYLHKKLNTAYCNKVVEIDNNGYCDQAFIDKLKNNPDFSDLVYSFDSCVMNSGNSELGGRYQSLVAKIQNDITYNNVNIKTNEKLDLKVIISEIISLIYLTEKIKSFEEAGIDVPCNVSELINYLKGIKSHLQFPSCLSETEVVPGINCLIKEYDNIKNILQHKAIFSLDEISTISLFYENFSTAISNFIKLLDEFHTFYNSCNKEMVHLQDDYFVKNYEKTKTELNTLNIEIEKAKTEIKQIETEYINSHPGRRNLSVETEIDWDDTPTIYQNTTIAHGHILHFKQVWKADGYSLGDLLYSLPLAPCQEKQIAIIDWDRQEKGSRLEDQDVKDSLEANISRDRDIAEIVSSSFSEDIHASSYNKTKSSTASIGGGLGGTLGKITFGLAGGYSHSGASSSSRASQSAARNTVGNSLNNFRDRTTQAAQSLRNQRNTVIQTVKQNESVNVQTEVIKNNNHCHSMTIEYFEVLKHYALEQELVDVQECLFVPLPMSDFDIYKVLRWKNTLRNVIQGRELHKGFNALERSVSNYDYPNRRFADEPIEEFTGFLTISFDLVRPEGEYLKDDEKYKIINHSMKEYFPWFGTDKIVWIEKIPLSSEERNKIFEEKYVPEIARKFVDNLRIYAINDKGEELDLDLDLTLASPYRTGAPLRISINSNSDIDISRADIKYILIRATTQVHSSSRIILNSFNMHYRTKHNSDYVARKYRINNDIMTSTKRLIPWISSMVQTVCTDAAYIYTPLTNRELQNPKKEDLKSIGRLIDFLNENLELTHKAIWASMDSSRLFGLLDGYIAPNSMGRSIASVVSNKIMGIVGNNLILSVVPGERLDPVFADKDLFGHYKTATKPAPFRISVPTKGVYAESVMGNCNSCEEIDETRHWRYEEVSCGTKPTQIAPVSTESRRADIGNLQVKDLPTNIINMQTPQSAPDPTGLAAAYNLLGKSDAFKDMTGLVGTQANAISALKTTSKSATDMASISKDFASLAVLANQKNSSPKKINEIKKLNKEGYLSDAEAKSAISEVLGQENKVIDSITGTKTNSQSIVDNALKEGLKNGLINQGSNLTVQKDGESIVVDNKKNPIKDIKEANDHLNKENLISLVGMPDGKIDLSKMMTDYLEKAETINEECSIASLQYFTNACKTKDIEITNVGKYEVPVISTKDGKAINKGTFMALWHTNRSYKGWDKLNAYAGLGAVGAMYYAGLLKKDGIKISGTGWPSEMEPGAVMQLWKTPEMYEDAKSSEGGNDQFLGHSCIFLSYNKENPKEIIVQDQNGKHTLTYPHLDLKYVIAGNLGKANDNEHKENFLEIAPGLGDAHGADGLEKVNFLDSLSVTTLIHTIIPYHNSLIKERGIGKYYGTFSKFGCKKPNNNGKCEEESSKEDKINYIKNTYSKSIPISKYKCKKKDGENCIEQTTNAEKNAFVESIVESLEKMNCILFVAKCVNIYLDKFKPNLKSRYRDNLDNSRGTLDYGRGTASSRFLQDNANFGGVIFLKKNAGSSYKKEYNRLKKQKKIPYNKNNVDLKVGEIIVSARFDKVTDEINDLNKIWLGFGSLFNVSAGWGYHTFVIMSGKVYESHWDGNPEEKGLFEVRNLSDFVNANPLIHIAIAP